jgi:hypothetical protein
MWKGIFAEKTGIHITFSRYSDSEWKDKFPLSQPLPAVLATSVAAAKNSRMKQVMKSMIFRDQQQFSEYLTTLPKVLQDTFYKVLAVCPSSLKKNVQAQLQLLHKSLQIAHDHVQVHDLISS